MSDKRATTKNNHFIDLETLFDIPFAIFIRLFPDKDKYEFDHIKYMNRISNFLSEFTNITDSELQKKYDDNLNIYELYDIRELLTVTRTFTNITEAYKTVEIDNCTSPIVQEVHVMVNSYPMKLVESEKDAILSSCYHHWTGITSIDMCYKTPTDLTPKYLSRYNSWVTRRLDEWITIHKDNLLETPIPGLNVTAPICYQQLPTEEFNLVDVASVWRRELAPVLTLDLMTLQDFSLDVAFLQAAADKVKVELDPTLQEAADAIEDTTLYAAEEISSILQEDGFDDDYV